MRNDLYGRRAYEAYRARTDKHAPNFDHLSPIDQDIWIAVAQVVIDEVEPQ